MAARVALVCQTLLYIGPSVLPLLLLTTVSLSCSLPLSLPSPPPPSSVLFQIAHLGDNDDEPEFSSAMPLEEGETFFFAPRPLKNLIQVDEMESLSPIMAAHVRGLGGGGGGKGGREGGREGGRGRKEGKKGGREEGRSQ